MEMQCFESEDWSVKTTAAVTQIRSLDACIVCPEIHKTTELSHAAFNTDRNLDLSHFVLCRVLAEVLPRSKNLLFGVLDEVFSAFPVEAGGRNPSGDDLREISTTTWSPQLSRN
jgi:hypothetical protein